jgi:hypothetical protein
MNINDIIYFSKKYKILDLKFDNKKMMISAFKDRIESFYFKPIELLNKEKHAFAAGMILLSLIDALARYNSGNNNVGERYQQWILENIESINSFNGQRERISKRIYEEFRCKLIHESHIGNGGQFSYEMLDSIKNENEFIIINPDCLFREVKTAFEFFIEKLKTNEKIYKIFSSQIGKDFKSETQKFSKYYSK